MTATRVGSYVEHGFRIADVEPMAMQHNARSGMFQPNDAVVIFRDGLFDRINIFGLKIAKTGKLLKTQGYTSFDADYLNPAEDFYIPPDDEMPQWAKDLVYNVQANPLAAPEVTIEENA